MKRWISRNLFLTLMLLPVVAAAEVPKHTGRPPPLCSTGSAAEKAACWKQAAERLLERNKARQCGDPSDAGTGASPCFLNNVDSTCYYASGAKSDICHTPRCAHGSKVYSDGSCADDDLCPADTPRAGLPPDPVSGCGVSQPGAGGEGFKAKGFLLKPGEGRSEKWTYYVGSGQRVLMSATVQSSIHGRPEAEAQGLINGLMSGGWSVEAGQNAPTLVKKMVGAFEGRGEASEDFGGQRLGFTAVSMPPLAQFVGGLVENSKSAEASATGTGQARGYGYVTFLGAIENRFKSPITLIRAFLNVPPVTVAGSCPATAPAPLSLPADSEYVVLGGKPAYSEHGCRENIACEDPAKPESCRVVSATTHGIWRASYQVLGPNIWVTDVEVKSDGGSVFSY